MQYFYLPRTKVFLEKSLFDFCNILNYNACAVDTFIYLDGKYIGKIGNGDYWQGNVPEGEHEIETVLSPGFHAAPKLLETYKTRLLLKCLSKVQLNLMKWM